MRLATLFLLLCSTGASEPATKPATAPASGDFEVHEWIVLVSDPYQPKANADGLITATLPGAIDTRRKLATTQRSQPYPVGIMRFVGTSENKVDVKLEIGGGKLMSAWPKPGTRSSSVLWRDLALSSEPQRLIPIDEGESWVASLRHCDEAAYVSDESTSERFLLYDAELPYTLPLKLAGGHSSDETIFVANVGTNAIHEVTLYRPRADGAGGWASAHVSEVRPGKKLATPPTTVPSTTPTTGPSTQPAMDDPSRLLGVEPADVKQLRLAPASSTQPSSAIADWDERLSSLGVLGADRALVLRILELDALDANRLTAVYRLDDAELDRLLPLEIIPQPRKITRAALVIVRNCDPAVPAEIEKLILQLGDDEWRKREAATKALADFGLAAKPKLEQAAKNSDPEIAVRAERLLAGMSTK